MRALAEPLLAADRWAFDALNGGWTSPWLDAVMRALTDVEPAPWLVAIGVGLLALRRRRGLVILLGAACVITLSDQLSAHVIKPLIGRVRPCHVMPAVHLLVDCSPAASFPSAHAANTFAGALYFSALERRLVWPLFLLAALISFSRIYVGVHYPLDLVGGALLGLGCARLGLGVMRALRIGPPAAAGRPPPAASTPEPLACADSGDSPPSP